ncbi:MAG TPA: O-antigen ligase family protein [Granulicella sp.]|jgi:exopolysaccharide production protein ExoQ|nr:O-antigen ligase family protein [Granulicella sp.]
MADKFYRAVIVLLFLSMMGVILGMTSPGLADTDLDVVGTGMHAPVIATEALVYLVLLVRLCTRPQHYLRAASRMVTLLPLLAICLLSALWASNASLSLRHTIALIITCLVGVILGADFEVPEIVRLFSIATTIHIALIAVFFVVSRHSLYSPSDPLSLKGLTTHKNVFGFTMALAVIAYVTVPFRRFSMLRWPLTAIAFGLLLLSRSSGSLVSTLGALAVVPFLFAMRFRGIQRIPLLIASGLTALVVGVGVISNEEMLPGLFSKDATLTGRTELWSLIRVAIDHHPWLGYGFDSFWQGLHGDSLNIILGVGWLVPTAHNGYYDLMLGIGYVGLLCFLPAFFQMLARALRYLNNEPSSARYFPIAFIGFWLIYNLNESALITRSGIPFLLFVSMSASLAVHCSRNAVLGEEAALGYPDNLTNVGQAPGLIPLRGGSRHDGYVSS